MKLIGILIHYSYFKMKEFKSYILCISIRDAENLIARIPSIKHTHLAKIIGYT
jgi:hypothetical protein